MVRPHKPRRIGHRLQSLFYKPAGIPVSQLERVEISIDELEALRLVDAEFMDQATAAEHMNVSRATVGRILSSARKKTARALSQGMAIAIESGSADLEFYTGCPKCGRKKSCYLKAKESKDENCNQQ